MYLMGYRVLKIINENTVLVVTPNISVKVQNGWYGVESLLMYLAC